MSQPSCDACNDLREYAPSFAQNGVTKEVANSLKNNTGFNPNLSVLHENCEDLNDANDCLVGRMDQELESYEVCDWKKFMHKFIPNLYELLKAIIMSMCGLWTNVDKIWCWLNHMTSQPTKYELHAYKDDDPTKPPLNNFRIADGVIMRSESARYDDPIVIQVMGNVAFINGSLNFNGNMPTSYTNGQTVAWNYLEHGCAALTTSDGYQWGEDGNCRNQPLIWEIQFNACEYGFKDFFGTVRLGPYWNGDFECEAILYKYGDKVPTDQNVRVDSYTFLPRNKNRLLLQVRLQNTRVPLGRVTPNGMAHLIACPDTWSC